MNKEDFFEEVMISLGGNLVDVELEDKELNLAFKKAKRTFIQKGHNSYRRMFYKTAVTKGCMIIPVPYNVDTVVRIIKPRRGFHIGDDFSLAAFNDIFPVTVSGGTSGDLLSYELTLQKLERWEKYMATDVDFNYDPFKHTISIMKAPLRDEVWLVELYTNLEDSEYMDILWIQNWTIAEAKIMLGTAYRKFSSLPSPDGTVSLDGGSLIQEGKEEKLALLEEIENYTDGAIDFNEITFG